MNICMITTTYPRFWGDTAAPFIASIAEGIAALGHSVDMILPFHPQLQAGERNGVRLHPYHVPGDTKEPLWGYAQSMEADTKVKKKVYAIAPLALYQTYRCASRVASEKNFDLIHAHWVLPNGFPAARLARKLKLPFVVSLHGSDMFLARKKRLFARIASSILNQAAVVTACSPDLQQQAEQISKREVTVLEYGVAIDHFAPKPEIDKKSHTILAVGRLVYKKGFLQLLDAFAKVLSYYPDSTLTIAGSGPLLSKLLERSRLLGISQAVSFPGNVERDRLPWFYAASDVVAVPSVTDEFGNRDGLPNVFLEAMSSGCAVVASDIPGIRNVVGNRKEALVVPSGDVGALADAIVSMLGDLDLNKRLRAAARKKAVEELSWEVKCKQLESIYLRARDARPCAQ